MKLSKQVEIIDLKVHPDGRLRLTISEKQFEGGVAKGILMEEKTYIRLIEVGDDVSKEILLIRDVVNGLHTKERIAARKVIIKQQLR